mmetsp:Transcript_52829/g.146689  ORF Transcript_52829/g.146689 Transcript_52829/m.146689 type:complete len:201 (+) Transcript_52829:314-916(+)
MLRLGVPPTKATGTSSPLSTRSVLPMLLRLWRLGELFLVSSSSSFSFPSAPSAHADAEADRLPTRDNSSETCAAVSARLENERLIALVASLTPFLPACPNAVKLFARPCGPDRLEGECTTCSAPSRPRSNDANDSTDSTPNLSIAFCMAMSSSLTPSRSSNALLLLIWQLRAELCGKGGGKWRGTKEAGEGGRGAAVRSG